MFYDDVCKHCNSELDVGYCWSCELYWSLCDVCDGAGELDDQWVEINYHEEWIEGGKCERCDGWGADPQWIPAAVIRKEREESNDFLRQVA